MRKQAWLALGLALMTGAMVNTAGAQTRRPTVFTARLTGAAERPNAVNTRSFGTATIRVDRRGHKMDVEVTVNRIENVTQAHIHLGGPEESGPPIVQLYGPAELVGRESGRLFSKTVTAGDLLDLQQAGKGGSPTLGDLIDEMIAGNTYINVHTAANPGGEIRGQIRSRTFR